MQSEQSPRGDRSSSSSSISAMSEETVNGGHVSGEAAAGELKEIGGPTPVNYETIAPGHQLDRVKTREEQQNEDRVAELARQISHYSTMSHPGENPPNPFLDSSDPALNPTSGRFNPRKWVKTLLQIQSRDPDAYPGRTAGVAFESLNVHGFGSPLDYQKDVANVWLEGIGWAKKLFGQSPKRKIQILQNFEGLLRSGEMCIVLGRPGSGCSTFLKTIAGVTYGFYIDEKSQINYQGIPREMMHNDFRGESIYNAETEIHFPHLTVGQTLSFAAECRAPRNRIAGVTRRMYAEHMRDVVMAIFGLSHTINTKVGNDFVRGVSGGERKRVSIAETALSGSPLQCWDNSTRGLDSATALEFVKTLRMSTELAGSAALVAIYQASQASYDVFDKAMVLYEGREIYFGPTTTAQAFFEEMGYECPPRQTTADFLTSLTNPSERVVKPGFEDKVPRTPDEFAAVWKGSALRAQLMKEIQDFNAEYPMGGEALEKFKQSRQATQMKHMSVKSPFTITVPMQVKLCVRRGYQRLQGDLSNTCTTIFGNISLSLIVGSVFYNLQHNTNSFFSRGALLFYAVLLNAFASALEILTLYAQRPIVEKHNMYALYHPFSEALASMIVDLPAKITVCVCFNLILYFITNLRREVDHFFIFLLFSFVCTLVMSNVFRTIAACTRTISQAMPLAAIFILALVMYTGFTIPIRNMVVWFRWINYINPIGYAFEAIMVNEFWGQDYPCSTFVPSGGSYNSAGALNRVCSTVGGEAGSSEVSGSRYLQESYQYSWSHLWRNLGILFGFFFFFLATYLVATEYIPAAKSKGEILVFRRGRIPNTVKSSMKKNDEESGGAPTQAVANDAGRKNELSTVLQKQTDIFHWRGVTYTIKIKSEERKILNQVDGWVKPGTLTALMGASGAGKTTLLDVLAKRVTMGVVTGEMLVNGHQRDDSFQRKTGYVQQQDLHLETATVREALIFSALLRQPKSTPKKEKLDYVEEVIRILEMEEYADAVVGVPGEGLNVEQRKRLTIGVELSAKPELLLFLDEPTSGLDSQTSWSICALLRKLANNGQAILCTIHQPSALLFQEFDRLLLLARGGRTVYFGPIGENATAMTQYFEKNGSHPCPPDANAAEWMLEVIGAAPGAVAARDWPEVWLESPERVAVREELARMDRELGSKPREHDPSLLTEFAEPFTTQLWVVLKRVNEQYWRTPTYIYSKAFLCIATALFIGFSFYKADNSIQGLQNQMFSIFMLMTIFGNITQMIMPYFVTQRALYEVRERPSKSYSWQAFIIANIIAELPWQTFMAVATFFAYYYPVGLYRNAEYTDSVNGRGGLFFMLVWAFYMFTSTFTHAIIVGIETAETGGNVAQLLFSLTLIFCGVIATPQQLPGFWIFMYRVSPFTYLVSGMLSTAVAKAPVSCSSIEYLHFDPPSGKTCKDYMEAYITAAGQGKLLNPNATSGCEFCSISTTDGFLAQIDIVFSERWRNFGIVMAFCVFNIFAAIFLYWLARVPKSKKTKEVKHPEAAAPTETKETQ